MVKEENNIFEYFNKEWSQILCDHKEIEYEDLHDQFEPIAYCKRCGKRINDTTK